MSNKNIFIILTICLCVGAVYYLSTNKDKLDEISSLITNSTTSNVAFDTSSQGDLDADSLINNLNSQMLLVGMINPRNIDPAVDQFQTLKEKFTKTKLWTKLDLDSMIASQIGDTSAKAPVAAMPKSTAELFDLIRNEWKGIKEVLFAASRSTSPIEGPADEPINFPKLLLAMNFSDPATQNRVKGIVSSQIPNGSSTFTQDALTIERSKDNPDHYDVSIKSPFGAPLIGSIEFSGSQGFVTFGTKQKSDFFTTAAGGSSDSTPLTKSDIWKQANSSILPQSGSFVFLDVKGVAAVSKEIEKAVNFGEEANPTTTQLVDETFKDFGGAGFASSFNDGFKLRACGAISDSDIASRYRAMLNWAQADKGTDSVSPNLITSQTVFATSISGHFIQAYLDNALSMAKVASFDELKKNGEKFSPETKRIIENYLALNKLLKANPIRNINLVFNAPQTLGIGSVMAGAPPVDTNVLIEFKNSMTPANFSKLFNKVVMLFMADSQLAELPSAKVVQASEGGLTGDVIQLSMGAKDQYFGGAISESGFLFGNTQNSLIEAKQTIQKPSSILSDEVLNSRGLKDLRSTAGVTTFFSSTPLVQLLHKLAPEALTMAPPEMGLKIEDVKEVLDLLNVTLYGVQNSSQASEDVYCTEMRKIAI